MLEICAPLHVPPLRAAEREDAVLCEDVEAEWIDALLVDDDEVFLGLLGVYRLIAHEVLELDDLLAFCVCEAPFRLHEFLALLGRGVEEPGVHLTVTAINDVW